MFSCFIKLYSIITKYMKLQIVTLSEHFKDWAISYIVKNWGATQLVSRGKIYQAENVPGFVALADDQPGGLITYRIEAVECEILTINSSIEGKGIGTALIDAVEEEARSKGCSRIWLITTNDNTDAMRFYRKRGFDFRQIYRNAMVKSRRIKPSIPLIGNHEIPIKHEIEFELILSKNG